MDVTVERARNVDLHFTAPPSKSFTHRAMVIAGLAGGESEIMHPLEAEDSLLTRSALAQLGIEFIRSDDSIRVRGSGGMLHCSSPLTLDLGNSGTSLRLLTSVALLCPAPVILTGSERMRQRPVGDLVEALNRLGGAITCVEREGFPPIRIDGDLRGGSTTVDASQSSQFVSSILITAPYAQEPVVLEVEGPPASRSYLDITVSVMETFGARIEREGYGWFSVEPGPYEGRHYTIEGDYSAASYFFAIAAVCEGRVRVDNLNLSSVQGDRLFLNALEEMGCRIRHTAGGIIVERSGSLRGIDIDMSASPDTVQTLSMVAAFADSPTRISGIGHLKYKESHRIEAIAGILRTCGVGVHTGPDTITIFPSPPHGGTIDPLNDHRNAMAAAVLGLGAGDMKIGSAECVNKSFPGFWDALREAGLWNESY